MTKSEFVLRQIDINQDAPKLAEMWKASDEQWPGTWSGGAEITPQMVIDEHNREKMIDVFVIETDGKIVAYCSFNEREEDKGVGYVALLNVQPDYQGRSLARMLLQKCLERCKELGFRLLTLGTWSGNLKSVPLYKKTGFFWVPDTSVWMLNFIPTILNLPCAQPYFSRHEWYSTFCRELKQVEDEERWEGMKVFTYRWEKDGDMLTAWADREARKLTAIETNAFLAAAIADNVEPAKGMATQMRWRLQNKQDRPMAVSLIASGNEHIKIDHRASVIVPAGETVELEAALHLDADTPNAQRGKPVPSVRSLLIIDGEVLELGTGLRPQPAVAVSTDPEYVTLLPGVSKTVHLQLCSHMRQDVQATVSLAAAPGLTIDWTERQISIPALSFAGLPVTLQAARGGVHPIHATVYLSDGKTLPERLPIFCLPTGGVLADQGAQEARIENEWARFILRPRGGEMSMRSSTSNAQLGTFVERVGPPFWPSELEDKDYRIALHQEGPYIKATMTADMDGYDGLAVEREVLVGGGPLIQINNSLTNRGVQAHRVQISRNVYRMPQDEATITMPLQGGIIHSRRSEFPAAPNDASKEADAFAEQWAAISAPWGTVGMIWEDTTLESEFGGWSADFLAPMLTCDPQHTMPAGSFYLYVGPGDWNLVRQYARRLSGQDSVEEPISVETRPLHTVRLLPEPVVTVDDQIRVTLRVDNLRRRRLDGSLRLSLPENIQSSQHEFRVQDVYISTPLAQEVEIRLPPGAAAYEGSAMLETRLTDERISLPMIRLGDRSPVRVQEQTPAGQTVYVVDNGRMSFTAAPGFTGALTAWQEKDVNHLLSPFPQQKTFGWMSPWYGGVTPLLMRSERDSLPGKLDRETFQIEAIQAPDETGIPWAGVRLMAAVQREQLTGLQVELDYLTVGQSNVLKLVYRIRNLTTARQKATAGWLAFVGPDGAASKNKLRSAFVERKATPWETWSLAEKWGMAVNPDTGRTIIAISPYPRVLLIDWGAAGGHLAWMDTLNVPSLGTVERVCYLVLCDNPDQAKRYIPLSAYI